MKEAIELLKREALLRRNAAILRAKRDYCHELKVIRQIGRSAGLCMPGRPRKVVLTEDPTLKPAQLAREILREGRAMTTLELTIEVQRRGCRSSDEPRAVANAIRTGLSYYRRHFKRDEVGRWMVANA